jgi:hypothetical protein
MLIMLKFYRTFFYHDMDTIDKQITDIPMRLHTSTQSSAPLLLPAQASETISTRLRKRLGAALSAVSALLLITLSSCTSGFDKLNTNPTQVTEIDPLLMFVNMQLRTAGDNFEQQTYNYTAISCVVQHLSPKAAQFPAEMYVGMPNAQWEWWYAGRGVIGQPGVVKFAVDIVERARKSPADINILSAGRIWKVFVFHRITDLFGDVPYFEAGRGFYDRNFTPKYDTQEAIYRDMLKELKEAVAAFDPARRTLTNNDGVYRGDIARWRRFGNSLRLRLAMRLVKADPATAQREAEEAIAAGVMTGNADMAWIDQANGARIQQSNTWQTLNQFDDYRLSQTFVSFLDSTRDPRLRIINESPRLIVIRRRFSRPTPKWNCSWQKPPSVDGEHRAQPVNITTQAFVLG